MSSPSQPARQSTRIAYHEDRTGRATSMESVAFAHAREKRRARNKLAKASRRKNRG